MSHWTAVFPLDELPRGEAKLFKKDAHRVALFRTEDGGVFAVDNACPHEGYPLVQGEVKGCTLTCQWHNFKFDLRDGSCLKGDEDVRHYATRIVDGIIEVDLTAEDPARGIEKARASLDEAVVEGQIGRASRDVARLLHLGVPAVELLAFGAMLDARHAEYGTTHALPVATDLLEYVTGEVARDTLAVTQLMELVSEANVRRPRRNWPDPIPSSDLGRELARAVEDEDTDRAIGLVRGDLDAVGEALLRCASEHFLGFGHPLIYVTKALELLRHHDAYRDDILPALTLDIVSSTREDLLPPMAKWRARVDALEPRAGSAEPEAPEELVRRILDPKDHGIEDEFLALIGQVRPDRLVDLLVEAAARRFLNFDPAIHEDLRCQDNWLFVTHPLTFAHAIREALAITDDPAILKNLVWSLAFIRRSHRLEQAGPVQIRPHAPTSAAEVLAALDGRDPQLLDIANACTGDLAQPLRDWLVQGRATRPIYVAHQIKTLRVALQESRTKTPLLATLRFLATPMSERAIGRLAHESVQLVVHGNLPKLLAP